MLYGFIENKILEHLGIKPTTQQAELILKLSQFVVNTQNKDVFLLKGYAGTGKTTVISALVKALAEFETDTILLAPTGRAAKVFSKTANTPAYTIHKKIFRAKSNTPFAKYVLDINKHKNAIFIIDESSMISNQTGENNVFGSGKLLDDLMHYVFSGKECKIIFSGDTAQLPPVGMETSPALSKKNLEVFGFEVEEYELTEVVRQSLNSGILYNATILREMISNFDKNIYPKFKLSQFDDIFRITGSELIDSISNAYDNYGKENVIVVTRSNKTANKYNQGIRQTILFKEEKISKSDLIMIVKNNYFWKDEFEQIDFIANGDIVEIEQIKKYEEMYDLHFYNSVIYFADYDLSIKAKLLVDTLDIEAPSLTFEKNKEFYEKVSQTYEEIKDKKQRFATILKDKYLNALQIKFAYAVTCHKAQGGQWNVVFIDQSYMPDDFLNLDYLRWLYTALTRGVDKVYLVNFKDEFFEK